MAEALSVTTPEAAELLARPDVARLLKPFMHGPKTCGRGAKELGLPVESLHYRVQQFCRAGLLQVVGQEPRRGRPNKLYEAVATDFVFSSKLVSEETLHALEAGDTWYTIFRENLERSLPQRYTDLVRVSLAENGAMMWGSDSSRPDAEHQQHSAHPTTLHVHTAALYLTPAEAEALAKELAELFERYDGRSGPKRYAMILGLTPVDRPVD